MGTLKFAVVREDARLELSLIDRFRSKKILVVASGGCTALNLEALRSDLEIVAFDANVAQIDHVKRKVEALRESGPERFNVEFEDRRGLNQSGRFEDLFRVLRAALIEFVTGPEALLEYFSEASSSALRQSLVERWVGNEFWLPAFETVFQDSVLKTMFGAAATQHAPKNSYASYFSELIGRGLKAEEGWRNPFLQHILLGYYRAQDAPEYISARGLRGPRLIHGSIEEVPEMSSFDLVQISNVCDWLDDAVIQDWSLALSGMKSGALLLIRQLNNHRDLPKSFSCFDFDAELGRELWEKDRSLFYNRILVGRRR